ncbi:MAG: hypothetical protein LQ346_006727 [Caloplaca aetnensis]|nr:MAG: hypothetical protein LQ346_006727 [Caloplaca aetnensis]
MYRAGSHFAGTSDDDSDKEEDSGSGMPEHPFTGSETLLIGAHKSPRLRWGKCDCDVDEVKQQLKEAGRLNHILASKSYQFVDAQQTSLVLGSHGIQIGRNKTYKVVKEEPLKKGLLAAWENEAQNQNPREFENLWGVAVSLCTMNARRVRLVELFGERSVLYLLNRFHWTDQSDDGRSHRRRTFFEAVQSSDAGALGDLWDANPTWREELGKALAVCLRSLFKTGFDDDRKEFNALWLPPGCHGPRRVTITAKDQKWVKFLRDTTYSMTVAVVVEDKLGDEPQCKDRCPRWFGDPSVLETAISINRTVEPAPDLVTFPSCRDQVEWIHKMDGRSWKLIWRVSNLEPGKHFWVGPEDRLKIIRPLTKWHLLLEVDTVKRAVLRDILGLPTSERLSHWEYTDEDECFDIRPIPVHIIGHSL